MIIIFLIFTAVYAGIVLYAYRLGITDGLKGMSSAKDGVFPGRKTKKQRSYNTGDLRTDCILHNIDVYDGSSRGQKDVI